MNIFKKLHPLAWTFLLVFVFSCSPNSRLSKFTIVIVGEDNRPIEKAEVNVLRDGLHGVADTGTLNRGYTNAEGIYSETRVNHNNYLSFVVKKDGFYESRRDYQFTNFNIGRWQPWNPKLKIVLRKKGTPVPMYARTIKGSPIEIPQIDKNIGFDLIKFDWVAPYGKGIHPDFIFKLERRRAIDWKDFDGTLTLSFPNNFDGIQIYRENIRHGSAFKMPYIAPLDGYENKLILSASRKPGDYTITRNFDFLAKDINYIFRIRSKEKNGKVIKAMYGKIRGPIKFQFVYGGGVISDTTKIFFTYYVNPSYDRNLEFDSNRNLFEKLHWEDEVKYP